MRMSTISLAAFFAGVLGTFLIPRAHATTLGFDNIQGNSSCTTRVTSPLQTQGYVLTRPGAGDFFACSSGPVVASNGTTTLDVTLGTYPQSFTLTRANNGPFDLQSFDAAATNVFRTNTASGVVLNGVKGGNSAANAQFDFDGIVDGAGGQPDFQTFTLPGSFTDLTSATFTGNPCPSDLGCLFNVDNIRARSSAAAVPEPADLGLFAFALAVILVGLMRRRGTGAQIALL